ncbi:MAG: hypothetical protein JXB18_12095, partial [Sedimentisphaerales bacterium]|nr:hypothetical protein [Sedimentisphaerales bacterium]
HGTFNIIVVSFIVVFTGFVGAVIFWPEADAGNIAPTPVQPQAVASAKPTENADMPEQIVWEDDDFEPLDLVDQQDDIGELPTVESAYSVLVLDSQTASGAANLSNTVSVDTGTGGNVSPADFTSTSSSAGTSSGTSDGSSSGAAPAGGSGASGGSTDSSTPAADSGNSGGSGGSGTTTPPITPGGGGTMEEDFSYEAELEALKQLQPLPKVHYSYWLNPDFITDQDNSELLYQLARTCNALSISGEWANFRQVDACIAACVKVNKTNPQIPCTIGVNYDPWHREFRQDLESPIPSQYNFTIFNHPSYNTEIEQFAKRMKLVKEWVRLSNLKHESDIKVGALLLDSERFYRRENDPYWNEAMGKAQNAIHLQAVEVFPDARIEWYNRGAQGRKGTVLNPYVVDNLIMTGMSTAMYSVPFFTETIALFTGSCNIADTRVIGGQTPWKGLNVTPWVGLNYGFDWDLYDSGIRPESACRKTPWDYDVALSYRIGAELNSLLSPYDRITAIVLYPRPFDIRCPNWSKHYIEYCKGAAAAN